ncbi:hypothetical protein NUITMVS3_37620 [Shewanella xiamenensis]|nr:hypothetical protein NUITMVS2_31020 [Shewanella xiamenensis]GLD79328.1 hypothetical protein NUITMVS3_37620 [Shewanella xiamenensis]
MPFNFIKITPCLVNGAIIPLITAEIGTSNCPIWTNVLSVESEENFQVLTWVGVAD